MAEVKTKRGKPAFTFKPLSNSSYLPSPGRGRSYHWVNILQYDARGNFVQAIPDIKQFVNENPEFNYECILQCSRAHIPTGSTVSHKGYIWRRQVKEGDPIPEKIPPLSTTYGIQGTPVTAYNGKKFLYFKNAKSAAAEMGLSKTARSAISSCCTGKQRVAYGYRWKHTLPDRSEFDKEIDHG